MNVDFYYKNLKRKSANRNIEFDITPQDIIDKYNEQNGVCKLSGIPLKFTESIYLFGYASVDRIDSSIGYTKQNIQIVHKEINRMKSNLTDSEFINFCVLVAEKYKKDRAEKQ